MPVLSARALKKAFGGQVLLDGATLTITRGEKVGLLGINGAGKSTLLRILAGLEPVDEGVIDRRRDASILYLAQEPAVDDAKTPREIVLAGLREWNEVKARYDALSADLTPEHVAEHAQLAEAIERLGGWNREHVAIDMLAKLGVKDIDRPVATMSGGERRRVALASILVSGPELAILDEPTNHLDAETIEWLEVYLAETFPGAVLLVTHDRYVLDAVCDRVLELDRGQLDEYQGGYSDFLEQKAEKLALEARAEANRLNALRRERAWLLRGAKARTTKQKARIQRAKALMAAEPPREHGRVKLEAAKSARLGKTILDLEHLKVDVAGRTLIGDLTLLLTPGDRVGVVGPNGAGKTSLLKIVAGELAPASGKVTVGQNTKVVYFDQTRASLIDAWSVFDNVAGREGALTSGGGTVEVDGRRVDLRTLLEQLLFTGIKQRQPVGSLSGGERARVALAKALLAGGNLLMLDEPTNDLDVTTLGALEDMLVAFEGCVIVVSHDRAFLDRVATGILAMDGKEAVFYEGNYATYRSLAPDTKEPKAEEKPAPAPAPRPKTPAKRGLTYAERIELEGIMDVIAGLEAKVKACEDRLADPAVYASGDASRKAKTDLEAASSELAATMRRWEDLESRSG
jgi:ATP-binding cassette subfamily F protein uup